MLAGDTLSRSVPTINAREAPAASIRPSLAEALRSLGVEADDEWAVANYKRTVAEFCSLFAAGRLIEIGGGRDPLFSVEEIKQLGAEITINDISSGELAVLPSGYRTACFDVAGEVSSLAAFRNSFDLAFSRMVFEHVADGERAWANLYELLAPGGIGLTYVPTLYAFPFLVNWLLPDKLAARIVKALYKNRTDDADPIFPARYSWCFTDARLPRMLSAIGYREVFVQPFYGHGYYKPFPIVRDVHRRFTEIARRYDWRSLTSSTYIVVRK
jgi:SAM-dependent methyltransferase